MGSFRESMASGGMWGEVREGEERGSEESFECMGSMGLVG